MASQESPAARAASTALRRSVSAYSSAVSARPISRRWRPPRAGVVHGSRLSSQVSARVLLIIFAMVVTSQVVVKLGPQHVRVDHALRVGSGNRHDLQKSPAPVSADDEQPGLAVVVPLDWAQDVAYRAQDVVGRDPVRAGFP